MKFEQIRYVMAVYQTGSISKAAKQLYLSQPNISNALKNLEQELGVELFVRDTAGIRFTETGMAFVRHCKVILDEVEQINTLTKREEAVEFVLLHPSYPPVEAAFTQLCNQVMEKERYRLVMRTAQQYEAFRLLSENKADLAIITSTNISSHTIRIELERLGLVYVHLRWLPCNINLSKNHPLASDPDFHVNNLLNYPFVQYDFADYQSPYGHVPISFVNTSKILKVSGGDTRSYLIAHSSAYGIGAQMAPGTAEEKGLRCIPIPREHFLLDFGYLYAENRPPSSVGQRFLELLEKELYFLPKDGPEESGSDNEKNS